MGGGGESAVLAFRELKKYLVGHDPMQLESLYWKICNPTASLYNNRTQLHAALEFACMDIIGKKLGIRACDLLGGARSEEHTSELQSLMRISYAVFCLKKKNTIYKTANQRTN